MGRNTEIREKVINHAPSFVLSSNTVYKLQDIAPFGLNDLFGKIVRANKTQITKEIYKKKDIKWSALWIDLRIIPWEQ